MNLIELNGADVVRGGRRILDDVTLAVRDGEHTAILGPNGAGKSTLIKLVTLQLYPVAREDGVPPIRVFEQERWDVFALRSRLGIVSADLHDRFVHGNANGIVTGTDAVLSGFFATQGVFAHQTITDAMRAKASAALDRVGAGHLAAATLDTMSTGEARRVLIARALVHDPQALMLDEPTRGLDMAARHAFMERVRTVARQGTTILLVTHHVDEIIPEIDRVILLRDGRVAFDGLKRSALTASRLSELFDVAMAVDESSGYFHIRVLPTS